MSLDALTCSSCGKPNSSGTVYCVACGVPLAPAARKQCYACGASYSASTTYCARCGTSLETTPPPAPPETLANDSAPDAKNEALRPRRKSGSVARQRLVQVIQRDRVESDDVRTAPSTPVSPPVHSVSTVNHPQREPSPTVQPANMEERVTLAELVHLAQVNGVPIDLRTVRQWQGQGLIARPSPANGERTGMGNYPVSLIFRLNLIYQAQELYKLEVEQVREELAHLDQTTDASPTPEAYRACLAQLESRHRAETDAALFAMLSDKLGLAPDEITMIIIRRKNGRSIRLRANVSSPDAKSDDLDTADTPSVELKEYVVK